MICGSFTLGKMYLTLSPAHFWLNESSLVFFEKLFCRKILCSKGKGLNSSISSYLVEKGGGVHWRDSISLTRVDPTLIGHLDKYGEGKQEGCAEAQDG